MVINLAFTISSYTPIDKTIRKPVDEKYDYWIPLLEYFLTKANRVEFHCWNDEIDTIEELISTFKDELNVVKEGNLTIFNGNKTTAISNYLLNNSLNKAGDLKWFTVNLDQGEVSVFHSGHWGTEFFVPDINEKDVEFIKSVTPANADFHQFSY